MTHGANSGVVASRRENFSTLWQVGRAYDVRNGWLSLVELGDHPRLIAPAGMPSLATELARLRAAADGDIAAFASRWGLLGFGELTAAPFAPEPIAWIRAHAEGLHHVLALAHLLSERDEAAIEAYLDGLRVSTATSPHPPHFPTTLCADGATVRQLQVFDQDNPTETARTVIRQVVSPNLARVAYRLGGALDGSLQLSLTFTALVDIAYWHGARIAAGESELARCRECGSFFVRGHGRERFCPPSDADLAYNPKAVSRCGSRFRARKKRDEDRKKRQGGH